LKEKLINSTLDPEEKVLISADLDAADIDMPDYLQEYVHE